MTSTLRQPFIHLATTIHSFILQGSFIWVGRCRKDVKSALIRSTVLDFCEEKAFAVLFETRVDVELESRDSKRRELLLKFGHDADNHTTIVGDFTFTGERINGTNPQADYFVMFFSELAQHLAELRLLRSQASSTNDTVSARVVDAHKRRMQARLAATQSGVLANSWFTKRSPSVTWRANDWRCVLRHATRLDGALNVVVEAKKLFVKFVISEGLSVLNINSAWKVFSIKL